jgi:hypothetical protein
MRLTAHRSTKKAGKVERKWKGCDLLLLLLPLLALTLLLSIADVHYYDDVMSCCTCDTVSGVAAISMSIEVS